MGNTCSSVHIALTGTTPDAIKGIVRAYTTLGFERTKTAPPEGGKHVILLRKEGDTFLSVYDGDSAALNTGELKDLALAASKIFKTAAVCTGLYDSDTFEFVVFNAGKQVDLVMTDPEQYSGPLKVLSDASRAAAQVTETNDAFKIAFREGQGLDDLEIALLPVLPVESVRVHQR